jgi:hypothetical protein
MTSYIHTINPRLATIIGEPESILLNQLEYWISKCGRDIDNLDGKWIYNSYKKWSEQFTYWSTSKLRRTIKSLENLGLIKSTKVNSKKWNQTKWYSIDYLEYNKLLENKYSNSPSSKTSTIIYNDVTKSYSNTNEAIVNTELKYKDLLTTSRLQKNHQINENVKFIEILPIINNNAQKSPEVCICSKWTNRSVQNEQMLIVTKNNYTKNNSSENKIFVNLAKEEDVSINSKKEEEIANQMLHKWNNIFEYSLKPIKAYSNKKIVARLNKAYKEIFNSSMDNWEEYAIKVNSSKFLMGDKVTKTDFKATFAWLSKLDTIQMILSGEYGVGDRKPDIDNLSDNLKTQKREIEDSITEKIKNTISDGIDIKKEKKEFKEYLLTQAKVDKYGIHKTLGEKYNIGEYADIGRFMRSIYSIFDTENKNTYDLFFEEYLLQRYGNTNKESVVEKVADILSSFCEEKSLLDLQKMKKFKDVISKGGISKNSSILSHSIKNLMSTNKF